MKIAIIGGGAAGLVCGVLCAEKGWTVSIYERGERTGRKLLATGNGQCNIDNVSANSKNYHGKNPNFAKAALECFDSESNMAFWESVGLALTVKENGKVYPRSLQAAAVVDLLRLNLRTLGVEEKTECEIVQIQKQKNGFVLTDKKNNTYFAHKVIVATGGSAAQALGGSESGYRLLEKAGHKTNKPLPAIVQLKTAQGNKALSGQKISGKAQLLVQGKKVRTEEGEILFTDYGLSGVPILQLSAECAVALDRKKSVQISLDLVSDMEKDALCGYLDKRARQYKDWELGDFLSGFLPKRIAQQYIKEAVGKSLGTKCGALTAEDVEKIACLLKEKVYIITDTAGLKNAQATYGGIDTDDFNPQTMESYLVAGLYAVGEVLDICGDCGGFNLHWAVSSAHMAVKGIEESVID